MPLWSGTIMRAPEFWEDDGALATLLGPLGAGYDLAGRLRRALVRPARAPVPVVCVGNLVAGGAGKTPLAIAVLSALAARGIEAHALTRGYGGSAAGPLRVDPARHGASHVGDEALLLARAAPTWVARDRVAGASAATAAGARAIVMDDGFQNPTLAKDLSILAVDGGYGFGNARVMPAGPLRETLAAGLSRADAAVILGEDRHGLGARLAGILPVLHADLVPGPEGKEFAGQRVLAFAGIARPEKFFATLEALDAKIVARKAFPDHHPYTAAEIQAQLDRAGALDARPVTTEKDAVRLPPATDDEVRVLSVAVSWRDPAAMNALLDGIFVA
jgi:tetraacyldisaccharide 4'-kinase